MLNIGYAARKIGLGGSALFSRYNNYSELIDTELEKSIDFKGRSYTDGDIQDWPEQLDYSLRQRTIRFRKLKVEDERTRKRFEPNSEELHAAMLETRREHAVHSIDINKFFQAGQYSTSQVKLRLSYFWLNHFTVGSGGTDFFHGDHWANNIAQRIDGKFKDLLYFSTVHPGMLNYLDNVVNIGPRSPKAKSCGVSAGTPECVVGLNDNLARELLELHSVSPAAGYTETDIRETAKVLAGWGRVFEKKWPDRIRDLSEPWVPDHAEPGGKVVMGKRIPSGKKGMRVLTDFLAEHEATMDHLSHKLLSHFVGSGYPKSDLLHLKSVWTASDGHLPSIHKAVLELAMKRKLGSVVWPSTWCFMVLRGAKADLVGGFAEVYQSTDLRYENNAENLLSEMGGSFFETRQPNGLSEDPKDWISTEYLSRKILFSSLIYDHKLNRRTTDAFINAMGFSRKLRETLGRIENDRERFIVAACSQEMLEV